MNTPDDISNKVRASLDLKRRQGKFIGSFASYGYRKDPNDHSRLLIDEPAAAVVRDIFNWFLAGTSVLGIAKRLNAKGVPNPSAYKRQQGMNYRHPASGTLDGSVAGQLSAPYPAQSAVHRHDGAGQKSHEKLQAACQRGRA